MKYLIDFAELTLVLTIVIVVCFTAFICAGVPVNVGFMLSAAIEPIVGLLVVAHILDIIETRKSQETEG